MRPIVAHPERHRYFAEGPGKLRALVAAGAWLQITVDSLLGNHGREPEASGEELLRAYPDAVLATRLVPKEFDAAQPVQQRMDHDRRDQALRPVGQVTESQGEDE